jgi:hypothetical protein
VVAQVGFDDVQVAKSPLFDYALESAEDGRVDQEHPHLAGNALQGSAVSWCRSLVEPAFAFAVVSRSQNACNAASVAGTKRCPCGSAVRRDGVPPVRYLRHDLRILPPLASVKRLFRIHSAFGVYRRSQCPSVSPRADGPATKKRPICGRLAK